MQVTGAPPSNGDFELTVVGLGEDNVNAGDGGSGQAGAATETEEERYHPGNSSAAGAVANFVNTIVGAGIVGLPFALAQVRERVGVFRSFGVFTVAREEHSSS